MKGRHNQGQDTSNNCPIDNILSVWGGDQIEWKEESQDVCMLYWGSAHCQLQWREQVQREELDDISSTGFSTASHPTLHSLSCQLSNDRSLVLGRGRRAKGFWWRRNSHLKPLLAALRDLFSRRQPSLFSHFLPNQGSGETGKWVD